MDALKAVAKLFTTYLVLALTAWTIVLAVWHSWIALGISAAALVATLIFYGMTLYLIGSTAGIKWHADLMDTYR